MVRQRAVIAASLLLLACTLLSFFYATDGYAGCPLPDDLHVPPTADTYGSVFYNLTSPDGQYIAASRRAGSHGCEYVILYSCSRRQRVAELGCVGDIFPAESVHEVKAVRWESNTELRIRYVADIETLATFETVVDVNDAATFEVLGPYWRSLKTGD
jgi:hypothetical protein